MAVTPISVNLTLQVGAAHAVRKQLDGFVQERRNSRTPVCQQWSYVFLASTHQTDVDTIAYQS